jgi:NAD(P)-dependent dehydrogenase (short-subunit alcohol dehydrogenase family)
MMKDNNMASKICIVTGSNSGIGKATALGLAESGATVVMVCRDLERGEAAKKEIQEKTSNTSIDLMICNLSSQQQIREFVKNFKDKYQNLHILINNAGVLPSRRTLTKDGIEMQFATNYLAPFLLTNLLLDVLKASAPARIINSRATINFDDLQSEKKYGAWKAYGVSKLALVMFTYQLAKRLEGTGVTVNNVHPGVVRTRLGRDLPWYMRWGVIFFKSPTKGAQTSLYLATSPEVEGVTGKYFANKKEVKSSKESYNEVTAEKLWQISVKLTNLST